jgi:hypothetical protein
MCQEFGDNGDDLEEVDYNSQNPAAFASQQDPPSLIQQIPKLIRGKKDLFVFIVTFKA